MVVRFLFTKPKALWKQPVSRLIRWADGTEASHFAIQVITDFKMDNVYEIKFPRGEVSIAREFLAHNAVVQSYGFKVPEGLEFEILEWLGTMSKKLYSVPQLALIALCLIKPLNKLLKWSILNHDRALICTELGSRFIQRFWTLPILESHDLISIADVMEYSERAVYHEDVSNLWKTKELQK